MTLLLAALAAAIASALGTMLLRARAARWGLIDVPNERSLHAVATPRGGGIAVVATVTLGLAVMSVVGADQGRQVAAFVGTSVVVGAVGWRDDFRSLPPAVRLCIHIAAAIVAMLVWGSVDQLEVPGLSAWTIPAAAAAVATALWLVGLLNAYNFMDGIDGLASGQAVIAGIAWVGLCRATAPLVAAAGALLAGASAGFLYHNRPPARMFLGDAGSGFLGYAFALLPLIAFERTRNPRMLAAGVLVVGPLVFDSLFTFCRRLFRGENVVQAHRTHLYQRLVTSGWTHGRVTLLYLTLGMLSAVAAVLWARGASPLLPLAAAVLTALLPCLVFVVERLSAPRFGVPLSMKDSQ